MKIIHHKDEVYANSKCTLCEGLAQAMWSGANGEVFVCRGCALDTLPALIADALPIGPGIDHYTQAWRGRLEASFLYAVASIKAQGQR